MNEDNFIYKTYCELGITSHEITTASITKELNIVPNRFFNKGDKIYSKNTGAEILRPYNLWAIESKTIISTEESISQHIQYFKKLLLAKIAKIQKYRNDISCEISFWIWIETDNAGVGLDISHEELFFINSICNRIHFSLITRNKLSEV